MRVPWKLEKTKVTGVKEILAQVSRKRSQVNSSSESWPAWRRAAKTIVNSTVFEWFCASLILLCAVLVGVQAHWDIQSIGVAPPEVFRVLNTGFNLLFTVELILRVMVEGLLFFSWYNPSIHWNAMDAGLVTVALVEESIMFVAASTESVDLSGLKVLRTLRLARILRIVKVVRFFSELRIMVNGVIGSARSLCWALLLILLVNFLFPVKTLWRACGIAREVELTGLFGGLIVALTDRSKFRNQISNNMDTSQNVQNTSASEHF